MRYLAGFGLFWYDFIVGDSPILAIGGGAVLAVGALLVHLGAHPAVEFALPALVTATLAASVRGSA